MSKNNICFKQSLSDFPLEVEMGRKNPDWKLSRWNGDDGLRFTPVDDEGFTVRGNKRQLLYKGKRRSHRFTILGDGAFEYDCIFEKEPESNVITLRMDGAEKFDFLRQPDFVDDDFIKGSYAVYKKETLIGQGTGKLCHINRPLIIDARGRKVWGDLAVVGNELRITIPEWWLSAAKYPVVVDPIVGTNTIGSQITTAFRYANGMTENGLMSAIVVNQYNMPEEFNGTIDAFVYAYSRSSFGQCRPVLYTDFGSIHPFSRRSADEGLFDIVVNLTDKPAGWRSTTFNTTTNIPIGPIWFGISAVYFFLTFDFANKAFWYPYSNNIVNIPNIYQMFPDQRNYNYRISMYFNFSNPQHFIRTVTQGVTLNDINKYTADYKRTSTQTARGTDLLKGSVSFVRRCIFNVANSLKISRVPTFYRSAKDDTRLTDVLIKNRNINRVFGDTTRVNEILKKEQIFSRELLQNILVLDERKHIADFKRESKETVNAADVFKPVISFFRQCVITAANVTGISRLPDFFRFVSDSTKTTAEIIHSREINRKFVDIAINDDVMKRSQGFFRNVADNLIETDLTSYPVVFIRSVQETQGITDTFSKLGNYLRGLYVEAGNKAETDRKGDYYRKETDFVQVEGSVLRQLFIFIKLVSASVVRDFIIRRFLISKEQIILKSVVTREIIIESKIN